MTVSSSRRCTCTLAMRTLFPALLALGLSPGLAQHWDAGHTCKTYASRDPSVPKSKCNGWSGIDTDDCISKCTANELPPGCPTPAGGFKCAYAGWDESTKICQVQTSACDIEASAPRVWYLAYVSFSATLCASLEIVADRRRSVLLSPLASL